jgi:hypothetical protein
MPGMPITDRQVRRYMEQRRLGATQVVAAAKAGFSERTARRLEGNPVLPGQRAGGRRKRTRVDPFAGVWAEEIVPLLQAVPHLRGTTVLETLQRQHPGRFADGVLRSLQRRIAHWRATAGPERELIFRQEHPPGEQALSDFTDASSLAVTIDGAPFPHLLYHFWLAFSGWQYVKAIQGGESFTALTEGLQEALWQLGGVPSTHRTDRLSAAYRNLCKDDDAAAGYQAFCDHYSLEPTRNNPGVSHENGSVEAAHGHLKAGLREALALRGSRDFASIAAYQAFLAEFVRAKNARRRPELQLELKAMRPLPRFRTTDFSIVTVMVTRSGTIPRRAVHGAVAAGRFAAEGAHLRRPAELLAGHDSGAGVAAPPSPSTRDEAGARRRLPPPGRLADQEAAGVPPLGVSRRAVPAPGVPAGLGSAGRPA